MNFRFIFISSGVFIIYTVLSFLWHNNIFHHIYFYSTSFHSISNQNIWSMNFANALYIYGLMYFSTKPDGEGIISYIKYAFYYTASVLGFCGFMIYGTVKATGTGFILTEILWILISSLICGVMIFCIRRKFNY